LQQDAIAIKNNNAWYALRTAAANIEKLDKLDLRDVPKPGFSGVMHYKQACTIADAS